MCDNSDVHQPVCSSKATLEMKRSLICTISSNGYLSQVYFSYAVVQKMFSEKPKWRKYSTKNIKLT